MSNFQKTTLISLLLLSLFLSTSAQSCSSYTFTANKLYTKCIDLPYLNSFLHWNYHQSNGTVDIAYRHTNVDTSTWVVWALNPTKSGMIGAQSLVALHNSSGALHVYTSSVDKYDTTMPQSSLSFQVPILSAEYENNEMTIYATLVLPNGQTTLRQLWQDGPMSNGIPLKHPTHGDNMRAIGTINFVSGASSNTGGPSYDSQQRQKKTHGVLSMVSWGILMPIGALIARYLKVFKSTGPTWFYLHIICQSIAYIVGVASWGTGVKFTNNSVGIKHHEHGNIGTALFFLGTLQVLALVLRPKPDHKYRRYWNFYHLGVGYLVIILSIFNIFDGIHILDSSHTWRQTYIGFVVVLGSLALILEVFTWYIVKKRRRNSSSDNNPHISNGSNNFNGQGPYDTRSEQGIL